MISGRSTFRHCRSCTPGSNGSSLAGGGRDPIQNYFKFGGFDPFREYVKKVHALFEELQAAIDSEIPSGCKTRHRAT